MPSSLTMEDSSIINDLDIFILNATLTSVEHLQSNGKAMVTN